MDLPMRDQGRVTIGDALEGAFTGAPEGDLLTDPRFTGHKFLPFDRACGKNISTMHESFMPKDEQYPGPFPWRSSSSSSWLWSKLILLEED